MATTYKSEFKIGEKVFHLIDPEQQEMQITGLIFRADGKLVECRTSAAELVEFYEFELSHDIDIMKKTGAE